MTLSISILGPLVIESGDCRLGKVPKKARALLAFLAAQADQPVTRERLADLLWPTRGRSKLATVYGIACWSCARLWAGVPTRTWWLTSLLAVFRTPLSTSMPLSCC